APVLSADDATCTGGRACDASGRCRGKNGRTCAAATDCVSGVCADGVCCGTACDGLCQACRSDLTNGLPTGTCGAVAEGKDPRNACPDDGACSCKRKGDCDGAGACRMYPLGTACSGCPGGPPFGDACDGAGSC